MRRTLLAAGFVALIAYGAGPDQAVPTFDTFGPLPAATFGGSGIPNDSVAISTHVIDGGPTITLGLTAHQRFFNPPLTNPSALFGAKWNFGWFVDLAARRCSIS